MIASSNFGDLLHHLRKRAGLTQRELAAATDYSFSLISSLERGERLPDVDQVGKKFVPALGLHEEPHLATKLVEAAARTRGERLPDSLAAVQHQRVVPTSTSSKPAEQLPVPLTPMLGREADLKVLCNRMTGQHSRLLTLTGPPGVGKTRLALALAEQLTPLYQDGAKFVSLTTVLEANQLESVLLAAFDLTQTRTNPQARLLSHLRHKELLLVLDNFEQLLPPSGGRANAATKLVVNLFSECPNLQIVVTSRERLHLRGEQRHRVVPLTLDVAAELFLERVQLSESTSFQDGYNRSIVHQICQQLDCLPLALELAAAHADTFSPQALLTHVREHQLETLVNGALDLPDHQRTLRDAIQSSYVLLSEAEQRFFCSLSIFVGSFGRDAAVALGGTSILLEALVNKSLLTSVVSAGDVRFSMLETLCEFGREQLVASGQIDEARLRHARYCSELAQRASFHMRGRAKIEWLERLEQEHSNLRTALQWMLTREPASALALAVNLGEFWLIRGYEREAIGWLDLALVLKAESTYVYGCALLAASSCHRRLGNYAQAEQHLVDAEFLSRNLDDAALWLKFHRCAGWYFYDRHNVEQAMEHFQAGLTLAREQCARQEIVRFLAAIAHLQRHRREQQPQVFIALNECLQLLHNLDEPESEAFVMQQYGELEVAMGRYSSASQYYAKALDLHQILNNKPEIAWVLEQLAEVAWLQNEMLMAQSLFEQAHTLFTELDHPEGLMIAQYHLGQVERRQERLSDAYSSYSQSLRAARKLGNRHMIARNVAGLGSLALLQNDHERAAYLLGAAQKLYSALPQFLAPADQQELLQQIAIVQAQIDRPNIARIWQQGQNESVEQIAATLFPASG